jgi:hypothetical protein
VNHHYLPVLIASGYSELHNPVGRIRFRFSFRDNLHICTDNIARPDGSRPSQLVHAHSEHLDIAEWSRFRDQPHHLGGGMPAARDQPFERSSVGGFEISVHGLGVVGTRESKDLVFGHRNRGSAPTRTYFEVFKVAIRHLEF